MHVYRVTWCPDFQNLAASPFTHISFAFKLKSSSLLCSLNKLLSFWPEHNRTKGSRILPTVLMIHCSSRRSWRSLETVPSGPLKDYTVNLLPDLCNKVRTGLLSFTAVFYKALMHWDLLGINS